MILKITTIKKVLEWEKGFCIKVYLTTLEHLGITNTRAFRHLGWRG